MSEERLLQRLEDLNGRLAELRERLPQSCMDERYDRLFYARLTNEATDAVIPAHLFTVEDVNRLTLQGTPFREAYQQVAHEVQTGTYRPTRSVHHTHEGSIGNLCNKEIAQKMERVMATIS